MSAELAIIAGSSAAGVISAAVLQRLSSKGPKPKSGQKTADIARSDLASITFEKTLVSEAITRVYEAFQSKKIDRGERDRLLLKYKDQLDSINTRISELKPVAEYAEISEIRQSLATLLEQKISALDQKLAELSKAGYTPRAVDEKVQMIVRDIASPQLVTPQPEEQTPEEKTLQQLQQEIMDALKKLEQVEVDKD